MSTTSKSTSAASQTPTYDREVFVNVIDYHLRESDSGSTSRCRCGWASKSVWHADHVADVYEDCIEARSASRGDSEAAPRA